MSTTEQLFSQFLFQRMQGNTKEVTVKVPMSLYSELTKIQAAHHHETNTHLSLEKCILSLCADALSTEDTAK